LLARNAEGLFWLARYLERAASLARVIEMQSSFGRHDQQASWTWLLKLYDDEARFRERYLASAAAIVAFYTLDEANPSSIRSSLHWGRENARALRPFIPLEMWAHLNEFHAAAGGLGAGDIEPAQLPRTCSQIRAGCLAQLGIAEGTLLRDEGYVFFKLGLLIERADQTTRLLDVKFAQSASAARDGADEFVFWATILRTASAYQAFRRLDAGSADPQRVVRFLILSPMHPRSIGFCAREMQHALQDLRAGFRLHRANTALETCEVLMEGLQAAASDRWLEGRLHEFNDWVQRSLIALSEDIHASFFAPPVPSAPRRHNSAQQAAQS
jgi:uncharacterized alpha-E superfamily protein